MPRNTNSDQNENAILEYKYPRELFFGERDYVVIPWDFITANSFAGLRRKRVSVYIYLYLHCGLGNRITFTLSDIAYFLKQNVDRQKGGFNDKVNEILEIFSTRDSARVPSPKSTIRPAEYHEAMIEESYFKVLYESDKTRKATTRITAFFNKDKVYYVCKSHRFATLYRDEIEKIINSDFPNKDVLFIVFAYLRMMIYRRKNKLEPKYKGDINRRKEDLPEVYDAYYEDIGDELYLSDYLVKTSVAKLVELGLIYTEELPRTQYKGLDGQIHWITGHTLFCNTYKREQEYLLDTGFKYYNREISNKKDRLRIFEKSHSDIYKANKERVYSQSPTHKAIMREHSKATAKTATV